MEASRGPHDSAAGNAGSPFFPALPRERAILAGILVLALLLRVVWVLEMRANPYFEDPHLD
jgi:hypothetical protein